MTVHHDNPERPATGERPSGRDVEAGSANNAVANSTTDTVRNPTGSDTVHNQPTPAAGTPERSWSDEIETVYREQGREIWALFYAQCNDPDRAYDALQEAFLRLHDQNIDEIRDPRAWLVRVGRNWLRDVARRQRVAAKPNDGLDALPGLGPGGRDDPIRQLEHEELMSQVRDGLGAMKEQDREVLVLRYALGWNSNRIAEVLGSSASAVDMRLSRARKRLARHLESIGADS